ncbi:CRTAC1 family protein [Thalassotalea agariperforans]
MFINKKKVSLNISGVICSLFYLSACQSVTAVETSSEITAQVNFSEVASGFARENKNRRKWDAPTIADLDQDGYPDLLLNDHGYSVSVMWNNQGKYAKPYDILMGDIHGIAVGDFDKDGNLEVFLSRGGGSGGNARNTKAYRVKKRSFTAIDEEFKTPLALMRGRTLKLNDLDNDGDLDLVNFAFPSNEKNGESENYIYANTGNGQLEIASMLPAVRQDGQKTLTTDFNGDNITDLLIYGHGSVKLYQGDGKLTFTDVTDKLLKNKINEVTSAVEFDFDNDGDFDIFLTRGTEFKAGQTFYNAEDQVFGYYTKRGKFNFDKLAAGEVLKLENLQSQWPHQGLFVGESSYPYQYEGEIHSGRDVTFVSSDALGFPDDSILNSKEKGTYVGYVGNNYWRIAGDIFSPSTGVAHGIKSAPESFNDPGLDNVLLENRDGKFVDVTNKFIPQNTEHSMGVSVADFNNDGFQDLVIVKRGNLVSENVSVIYLNQDGKSFTQASTHGVVSTELGAIGMGVETVDYNLDGFADIVIGNERGKWHLFQNESNNNGFLRVIVNNSVKGDASAVGAMVKVDACKLSQVKRVGGASGAAYSQSFDNKLSFGLGRCNKQATVKVTWSNGETEVKTINTNADVMFGK